MYLTELEQLVLEDENRNFNNQKNVNSTLLKLQCDSEFRDKYYSHVDFTKYSVENYNKIKNIYEREFDKMDKLSYLSHSLNKLNIKSERLNNKIDSLEMSVKIKKELLDIFNKELSYILYLNIISEEEALNRGFDSKYIKRLKRKANLEIENAYDAYLDDDSLDDEKALLYR